jgi:hypothetical protein
MFPISYSGVCHWHKRTVHRIECEMLGVIRKVKYYTIFKRDLGNKRGYTRKRATTTRKEKKSGVGLVVGWGS